MSLNIQNLDRLISHLEGLPEEKFDMSNFYTRDKNWADVEIFRLKVHNDCGTAACIAGWIYALAPQIPAWMENAVIWLGMPLYGYSRLFMPPGYDVFPERYPLSRAIRTLKHMRSEYLRTGEVVVDWDAPEPVTKPEWTAPRAVEQAKPTLPAEIVRFLRTADLEVSA